MHDRASLNNVAVQTWKIIYPTLIDIGCFSHTPDLIGEKFCTPTLNQFFKGWINMISRSVPRPNWFGKTGQVCLLPSTRLQGGESKWEVLKGMLEMFGDVCSFLQRRGLPPKYSAQAS